MDPKLRRNFVELQQFGEDDDNFDNDSDTDNVINMDRVLDGTEQVDVSHSGADLQGSLESDIEEEEAHEQFVASFLHRNQYLPTFSLQHDSDRLANSTFADEAQK